MGKIPVPAFAYNLLSSRREYRVGVHIMRPLATKRNQPFVTADGQTGVVLRLLDEDYAAVRYDGDTVLSRVTPRRTLFASSADDLSHETSWDDVSAYAPMV